VGRNRSFTAPEAAVLMALAAHCNKDGKDCEMSNNDIADWTKLGRRTVIRTISDLVGYGCISRTLIPGKTNGYLVNTKAIIEYSTSATESLVLVPQSHQCHSGTSATVTLVEGGAEPPSAAPPGGGRVITMIDSETGEVLGDLVSPPLPLFPYSSSIQSLNGSSNYDLESKKQATRNSKATQDAHARTERFKDSIWLQILREIPNWDNLGEPHLDSMLLWVEKKDLTEDELERSAIGLGKAKQKTLRDYGSLARAFQDRINKGYDKPTGAEKKSYY